MFESFVILLREGVEAALVVAILMVALRRTGRRDLERPVFAGLGAAVAASVAAAIALTRLPVNEELYEGALYWVSALFVVSMMVWMHRNARHLRSRIVSRVERVARSGPAPAAREAWALGAFAFLMVFREGAETVLFLSAVRLTTDSLLSLLGALLGLGAAVVFGVLFVQGSVRVDLRRFFFVTEWVLGIFVVQLVLNGYHEMSEARFVPATPGTMALIGPIVRNNSVFTMALVAIPLFIWLSRRREAAPANAGTGAERRLAAARARGDRLYRRAAIGAALSILLVVGLVFAKEREPAQRPEAEAVETRGDVAVVALTKLEDGRLHHFGVQLQGRLVRFLAMKGPDGKVRTALDACEICGAFGYVQEGRHLTCLNCAAAIPAATLGARGGCNPIPLQSRTTATELRVPLAALRASAPAFDPAPRVAGLDPVCGMKVEAARAAGSVRRDGQTYYFCSAKCQAAFEANPEQYVR